MQEIKTEREIRAIVPAEICPACFHLTRRMHRKFHGKWRDVTERFLPSYIFIDTDDLGACYAFLKHVPTLTKVVGFSQWDPATNGVEGFHALNDGEEALIRKLAMGSGATAPGVVDISRVEIIEGDRAEILEGPLMGLEGSIKKLDLHHRQAVLAVSLLGRDIELRLGIEVVKRAGEYEEVYIGKGKS